MNNTTQTRLGRKLLSRILVFVMALSVLPTAAFAAEPPEDFKPGTTYGYGTNPAARVIRAEGDDDLTRALDKTSHTATIKGSSGGQDEDKTYEDGIYVGTATVQSSGRFESYDITVVVTVSGGEVTNIEYSSEVAASNASFATKALTNPGGSTGLTLAAQINNDSAGVDAVSGATYSSEALWTAVQNALNNGPTTDPRSFVLTPAIYDKGGTTFTIEINASQNVGDYTDIVITYSMGKTNGTFEKNTDYTAKWDKDSNKVTVTILPTSQYNKLGQLMTVSCAGNSVGSLTIKSGSTVAIADNKLTVTGSETLEDYFNEITTLVINGTSYSIAGTHGATPTPITDFFDTDGSVNFNSDKFADGADGSYKISIEANGFDMFVGTVGSQSGPVASANKITVPEGLADGNYQATVKVDPDDATDGAESFDFYNITVTVTVMDGAITNIAVSGATGSNTQYSKKAETGIGEQITGKGAGDHDVDAVSMATCSSVAIIKAVNEALKGTLAGNTSLTLSEAIYEPDGTSFFVTVSNPDKNVDYSTITLSYAAGKFAEYLTDDGYTVELVSESDSELVYKVTILNIQYIIDDDSASKYEPYNELGRQLDVTVADTSAGRVVITSSATVELKNNQITLTGGKGETLTDYLEAVEAITISYTDTNGKVVENRYAAKVEHDQPVEYYPTEIFNEDTGNVNFDCGAFAYGETGNYTITIETMNDCFRTIKAEAGPVTPNSSAAFTDVADNAWYAGAVQYVYEYGLMDGTSDTSFEPEIVTSRAMIVTILYRLEGKPTTDMSAFSDVRPGQWYTDAVAWATRNQIVTGYDGAFRPDDPLTRQDMATILYRYASYKGYNVSARADLSAYTDAGQVSGYAADAMSWANAAGLITGVTAGTLVPQGHATRAEVAAILTRFCENFVK